MNSLHIYHQITTGQRESFATHKFGVNPDIDGAQEDVWEAGGSYTGWATAAETLEIFSSDADNGELTLYGLDANWNAISETITLTGTTPVITTLSYIRSWRGVWQGSVDLVGTVTARQSTTTANVMWTISPGENQTLVAVFSTRAGHIGLLKAIGAAISKNVTSVSVIELYIRNFGQAFNEKEVFALNSAGTGIYQLTYEIPLIIQPKSDIVIRADSSAVNNKISAWFDIVETVDR